jgi:hypothetical protein
VALSRCCWVVYVCKKTETKKKYITDNIAC